MGRRSRIARIIRWFLITMLGLAVMGMLSLAGLFWYFSFDLPDIDSIDDYVPKQLTRVYSADGHLIDLWVDEELIYRTLVPLESIPEVMRQAMLAAEDSAFYSHSGLDYTGVLRAIHTNLSTGSFSHGASTITQQVVKNLLLTPERAIRRKVQEVLLAFRLEDHLTKDEILTIYLNEVYFGGNRYGVEAAAQYYFGHSISQVDLAQASLLAGLVQSPSRYNPYRHPERALERRRYVLQQMWEKGFISESIYRSTLEEPLVLASGASPYLGQAPHFCDHVRRQLFSLLGREQVLTGGLVVRTTLRIDHQEAAERALTGGLLEYDQRHNAFRPRRRLNEGQIEGFRRENSPLGAVSRGETYSVVVLEHDDETQRLLVGLGTRELALPVAPASRINPRGLPLVELYARGDVLRVLASSHATMAELASDPSAAALRFPESAEGAFVSIDPTNRHVLAMVGGFDYRSSSFNRVTQARRPSGSTFKPFIYGVALANHLVTPASIVRDEPTPFRLPNGQMWNPQNSDGTYLGPISLRDALARSRNVVSVRLLEEVGLQAAQRFARQAGIESPMVDNLTMSLGSSEIPLLELANAFASIASGGLFNSPIFVTEVSDHTGAVVWGPHYQPERVMDEALAFLLTDMLTSAVQRGTATRARALGRPAAGKTGTTNEARDAWFLGYVPQLLAGAWVGFDQYLPLGRNEYGGRAALPIWLSYMQAVLENEPVLDFVPPANGLTQRRIDPQTGLLARPDDANAITERFLSGTEPARYAPSTAATTIDEVLLERDAVNPNVPSSTNIYDDF